MAGESRFERHDPGWVALGFLAVGLVVGAGAGVGGVLYLAQGTVPDPGPTSALSSIDSVTPSEPGSSLRILQAIGLLLPLFVALLRVIVNPASEFDINPVSGLLLLGIVGLVLAGALAVVAGFFSNMAFVLKLSLLCLLAVFAVIAYAAAHLLSPESPPLDGAAKTELAVSDETVEGEQGDANSESDPESEEDPEAPDEGADADSESASGGGAVEVKSSQEGVDGRTENGDQQL